MLNYEIEEHAKSMADPEIGHWHCKEDDLLSVTIQSHLFSRHIIAAAREL